MSLLQHLHGVSIRAKFVVSMSIMLVISMLIVSGFLINRQSHGYRRELQATGETMIKIMAMNAESGVLFGSAYELNDLMIVLKEFGTVESGIIMNRDDSILAQTGHLCFDTVQIAALRRETRESNAFGFEYITDTTGREYLVLAAPVTSEQQNMSRENLGITGGVDPTLASSRSKETIGWIELGLSVENVDQAIATAKLVAMLVTLIVVIATIIVVVAVVSAVTKPVTELVEATDQLRRGDFSTRVEICQRDEIGQLATTFNSMAESLKQSRDEIEQYNRTLEEKIIERTQQLEEAQTQLIQSEKMSAIGQLAAGVAHELNNPLGGILGYAQFTLEKLRKNVPEKTTPKDIESYTRYVGDIETQARRCKTIVQNLLRFSRSSRSTEFEEEVDVNQVIAETVTFVEHQFRISEIDLEVNLADDLPVISGNAGQLQQVFTNLMINAMHASEKGTAVRINTRYSPALGEFGGALELRFADSGHGIAEENLKKIFEPFFTTKEVGKGTGLGLSVSYGIVKEHGGEITVTSAVGQGTTFTIVLPVQKIAPSTDTVTELGEKHY
ncbi:MAG: HAMP domain-containing protein [candidate division Zixibacteria bacterium]|nr:HAMP domain-containing protein [candidate division Zixibacteria bacterium]